ncbi:MAG: TolC family protein [bacterium]|nr:TolC family protein [bacterium]
MFVGLIFAMELTLEKAINLALSNNVLLKSKELEVRIFEYKVKESASLFYPKLSLQAGIYKSNAEVLLPSEFLIGSIPDSRYHYLTRLMFKQDLYTGSMKDIYKSAKLELEKAKLEYEVLKLEVIKNVMLAYNDFLYYKKKNEIEKSDYTSYKLEEAKLNLIEALGFEYFQEFIPIDDFSPMKFEDTLELALIKASNKPELKQKIFEEQISETTLRMALNVSNPRVALLAGAQKYSTEYDLSNPNTFIMLAVTLPVFDGFQTLSKLRQDDLRLKKAGFDKLKILNRIEADVRKSYSEFLYYKNLLNKTDIKSKNYIDVLRDYNISIIKLKYSCGLLP